MNEQIYLRIYAKDDATPVLDRFNQGLKRTQTTAQKTKDTVMGTSTSFNNVGRSAGQAGIQIQQFVGQIQAGTNPMLALSQQAADLGIVLGAPLLGAIAGVAASFAMVLMPSLFQTSNAVEDIVELMDELTDSTDELTAAQKRLQAQQAAKQIEEYAQKIADAQEGLRTIKGVELWEGELSEADRQRVVELEAAVDSYTMKIRLLKGETIGLTKEEKDRISTLQRLINGVQEQAETLGMTNTQLAIYRARQLGASEADIERLQTLGMTIEAYEAQLEKEKEIAAWKAQYDKDRKQANADMLKEQEKITAETLRQLKPIEDSFVNLINGSKSVSDSFKAMAKSIIDDLIRIEVQRSITGPLSNIIGGMGGFGGIMSGLFGGGGAKAIAAPNYIPPSFDGGGYTGSGARSGGLDGKGGFAAMLHPNETVVDHSKGGSSGVVINQTINVTTGVQQTVRAEIMGLMPQIANASKQAVLDAKRRGGSFAGAF